MILWDVRDLARPQRIGSPLAGHTRSVNSVAFAPDGRILVTGSADRSVILWDVRDPAQPQRIGPPLTDHTDVVNSVAFKVMLELDRSVADTVSSLFLTNEKAVS